MKKNNIIWIFKLVNTFMLLILYVHVQGQSFYHKFTGYSGNIFQASGVQVVPNNANNAIITHDLWYTLAAGAPAIGHLNVKEMKTTVKFYIDHDNSTIYQDYTYRIKYKIKGYKNPADPNQFDNLLDENLTISYFPQTIKAYQDVHMKTYYGYYKVEVEILDVLNMDCLNNVVPCQPPNYPTTGYLDMINQNTSLDISLMAKNWALSVDIESQKIDKDLFDGNTWQSAFGNNAEIDISKVPPVAPDNHLTLTWNIHNITVDKTLPAMYELEWTYIDNYKVSFSTTGGGANVNAPTLTYLSPSNLQYDFKNNSTRIITDKTEFKIPLIFKKGYIAYRVRIIRPDLTQYKSTIYGPWTVPQDIGILSSINTSNYYDISSNPHLNDLFNWNYQVSYAEEGKSKHVVSYFDGLLKNRQSITKFGSLPYQQIVSESFYNYEGKVGLQTLPIPIVQTPLSYVNNFAKNSVTSNSYQAHDIDFINPSVLPSASTNSPLSKYYSGGNQLYNGGVNPSWKYLKSLPDDEGYPLIHTKYAPEDGRILEQGGAGNELQLGKGHETKYYYMPPTQEEMNKYFGINIGKSPYYEKTITKDPNKQHSFSIANNKGQIVMSGLMGYTDPASPMVIPDKVELPNPDLNLTNFPKKNLMYGLVPQWYGTTRKFGNTYFQESAGAAKLEHSIQLNSFLACTNNGNNYYLNVPIKYNIKFIDDYGQTIFSSPNPNTIYGTLGSGTVANNISINNTGVNKFLLSGLQIGKTTANYELSYNQDDVNQVVEDFIDPPPPPIQQAQLNYPTYPLCYKQYNEFLTESLDAIDEDCDADFEDDISQCDEYESMLLDDLMPMGRYASYSDVQGHIVGQAGSIFAVCNLNTNNLYAGSSTMTWDYFLTQNLYAPFVDQTPNLREASFERTDYCDFTNGLPNYRYQYYLKNSTATPASTYIPGTSYTVENLMYMKIEDFLLIYNEDIARYLLPMHPEYCEMNTRYCDQTDFVKRLQAIPTFSMASELGLSTIEDIFNSDPLKAEFDATNAVNNNYSVANVNAALLTTKIFMPNNGAWQVKSIKAMALTKTICGEDDGSCAQLIDALNTIPAFNTFVGSLSTELKNAYFENLVSLYLVNRTTKVEYYYRNSGSPSTWACPIFSNSIKIFDRVFPNNNNILFDLPNANNTPVPDNIPNTTTKINDTDLDKDVLNGIFSPIPTTTQANVENAINNENGFTEYADEIIKKLANCRDVSYNPNTPNNQTINWVYIKSFLINYMVAHIATEEAKEWKGGITPVVLQGFLNNWGIVSDDLCNPYLIDYLQGTNLMIKTCEEDNFYASMNTFFSSHPEINTSLSAAALSPNNFTSAVQFTCNFGTNLAFENRIIQKFYGANAQTGVVNVQASFNNIKNSFTLRIFTGSYSLTEDVTMYFNKTNPLAFANNTVLNTSMFNNIFNTFQCNGIENDNSIPFSCQHAFIVNPPPCNECVNSYNASFMGTVLGLNEPEKAELHRCITAKEMKDVFLGTNGLGTSPGCFMKDVMSPYSVGGNPGGYNIKGYGHPYWETAIRSYFNFRFKKQHTSKQYLDFIESCNLTEFVKLPSYYGYMYAYDNSANVNGQPVANIATLNNVLTNNIISFIKTYIPPNNNQGQEFSNFNYFNYYTKTANTLSQSNLYIDFNFFPKEHLRTIKDVVLLNCPVGANQGIMVNALENELLQPQNSSNNFADLFVHYDPTEPTYIPPGPWGPPPALGYVVPTNYNFSPDICIYNTCTALGAVNNFFNMSDQEVLVRDNNQTYLYKHYQFDLSNGALSPSVTSTKTYAFYNELMRVNQGHKSFSQYKSNLNTDNLDPTKKNYLNYTYSDNYFFNKSKDEAIALLLPDQLKSNIIPANVYDANNTYFNVNFNNYPYVSYYNPDKSGMSGDLFIKKVNGNQSGLDFVNAIFNYIEQNTSLFNFNNTVLNYNNYEIKVKYIGSQTMWFNIKDVNTHIPQNIYVRLPEYISTGLIPNYEYVQNSASILPQSDNVRRFIFQIHKAPGQYIEVEGKTDFNLTDAKILMLENVMLCDDPYSNLTDTISTCYEAQVAGAYQNAFNNFVTYKEAKKKELKEKLTYHLQNNITDGLLLETPEAKYMMTLYAYDRAGNLINTIPPEGVRNVADASIPAIDMYRDGTGPIYPPGYVENNFIPGHKKVTKYYYNSNNQVVSQNTPDAGTTDFFYDQAGRLIFSQNAKQKIQHNYSYTLYDKQNRIIETGEFHTNANMNSYVLDLKNQVYNLTHDQLKADLLSVTRREVTHTFYDQEINDLSTIQGMSKQTYLRSRVATIASYNILSNNATASNNNFKIALHYSYDLNGNVDVLCYDMPELEEYKQRYKRVDYDFDLYSGKVKLVSYNRSFADQFYQQYEYDDDNRITKVQSSKDGLLWDRDAEYTYYPHGPLARISLGDLRVQGVDFAYTLQGWLKSINGDTPDSTKDMGGDNANANVHMTDRLRSTLYYYKNDYKPIDPTDINNTGVLLKIPDLDQPGTPVPQSLYNGNIAASMVIPGLFPSLYTNYQYDQLNRIKEAAYKLPDYTATLAADVLKPFSAAPFNGVAVQTVSQAGPATVAEDIFKSQYSYDMDGNITHMKRFGLNTLGNMYDYSTNNIGNIPKQTYLLDSLSYWYDQTNLNGNNMLVNFTDRTDHSNVTPVFDNDLKKYIPLVGAVEVDPASVPRFAYDAIGNLTKDLSNNLNYIGWNLYGKIVEINIDNNNTMRFGYDPMNNRYKKSSTVLNGALSKNKNEYYIRDASGNILAVYRHLQGFHLERPIFEAISGLLTVNTLPVDIASAFNNVGAFSNSIQELSFKKANPFVNSYINNKSVGFYLLNNRSVKKGMIDKTPELIPSLLSYNDDIVINSIGTYFDENMFEPLILEPEVEIRNSFLNMMFDTSQIATMNNIMESIGKGVEINSKEEFVNYFSEILPNVDQPTLFNAFRSAMDSVSLSKAYTAFILDSTYRNREYNTFSYLSINNYLIEKVKMDSNEVDLIGYYNTHPDSLRILEGAVDYTEKIATVYAVEPVSYLTALMSQPQAADIIASALEAEYANPYQAMLKLVDVNTQEPAYASYAFNQVVDYDKFYLAEHHMYGSSRLGIKNYWQDQYLYQFDKTKTAAENQTLLESSEFYYRRPWYSSVYNSLIGASSTVPFGNANTQTVYSDRILGQKKYELTNHLGNVMAVLTDKIEGTYNNAGNAVLPQPVIKSSSLFAAYDYYPFGMLMPDRYYEDNTPQCISVSKTRYIKKWIDQTLITFNNANDISMFTAEPLTNMNLIEGINGESGNLVVTSDGENEAKVSTIFNSIEAGKEYKLVTNVANLELTTPVTVAVYQLSQNTNDEDILLNESTVDREAEVNITVVAELNTSLKVVYSSVGDVAKVFQIGATKLLEYDEIQDSYISTICNSDEVGGKDYRFGFNGQMKENEIAGVGNHNTALFWEYDTRLGRRWNLDPEPQINLSDYSVMRNNPILMNDVLGNTAEETKDTRTKTITYSANLYLYGKVSAKRMAKMQKTVQEQFNRELNSKTFKTDEGGEEYKVKFNVNVYVISESDAASGVASNTSLKNNYINVEESGRTSRFMLNSNQGMFSTGDFIGITRNKTTGIHEFFHGLGLHPGGDGHKRTYDYNHSTSSFDSYFKPSINNPRAGSIRYWLASDGKFHLRVVNPNERKVSPDDIQSVRNYRGNQRLSHSLIRTW